MRIVQLINRRHRRGAEVFATLLSDALAERGHDVELLGLYAPPPDELVPQVARFTDLGTASRLKLNPALVWRVARYIQAAQPDLVQANGSDTLKYATLAKWVSGGRWPIVYRNISVASQWLRWPGHRLWGRFLSGGLDYVVSVAEESREDFVATYGVPPQTPPLSAGASTSPRSPVKRPARPWRHWQTSRPARPCSSTSAVSRQRRTTPG